MKLRKIKHMEPHGTRVEGPDKVYNDRWKQCIGCPYPRHGLTCWSKDGSCLRAEMQALDAAHQDKRKVCATVG